MWVCFTVLSQLLLHVKMFLKTRNKWTILRRNKFIPCTSFILLNWKYRSTYANGDSLWVIGAKPNKALSVWGPSLWRVEMCNRATLVSEINENPIGMYKEKKEKKQLSTQESAGEEINTLTIWISFLVLGRLLR